MGSYSWDPPGIYCPADRMAARRNGASAMGGPGPDDNSGSRNQKQCQQYPDHILALCGHIYDLAHSGDKDHVNAN